MRLSKINLLLISAPIWFAGCELSPMDGARWLEESKKPASGTPADSTAPPVIVDTVRVNPPSPVDTIKAPIPVDTIKAPVAVDTPKPPASGDTSKPALPIDTSKVPVSVDTVKNPEPVDTIKKPLPVDTIKSPIPGDTLKPPVPADTAIPKPDGILPLLKSDLEDQSAACWGSRNGSGYATSSCGIWKGIGGAGARLAVGQTRRSGNNSMAFTFVKNEDVAGASLPVNGEVVNVRAWYQFAPGFDFGQGVKIGRISSFNSSTQMNDIDIILTVRSSGSVNQCGMTDMSDMGMFFNGRPVGYDWGNITANRKFERGRWYAIEYQVALNAPGKRDGSVKIWIDGTLAASKTGINIRGNGGSGVKLNTLRIGGWYSNSANGNSCSSPSQASTMFVDDVAVGAGYIGTN